MGRWRMSSKKRQTGGRHHEPLGVNSIETGMLLLEALAASSRPQNLKALSASTRMPAPKAHRYLVSFMRTKFVEREPNGAYRLGPAALRVGMSALGSLNIVRLAGQELSSLRDELGVTVGLAVWGTHGPSYVLVEEGSKAVTVNAKPGSVLPIFESATGRVFATFSSDKNVLQFVDWQLKSLPHSARKQFESIKKETRANGVARSLSEYAQGIDGISAPVFDHQQQLVAAITVIGARGEYDTAINGLPVTSLLHTTRRLSANLGYVRPDSAD